MTIEEYYHDAEKNYSPGPWTYRDNQDVNGNITFHGFDILYKDEWIVAHCFYRGCDGEELSMEKARANAELIAKSPAMVEAIERLLACPALNLDDLEPEDIAAFEQGYELIKEYIE